jgi:hypothetical protein
MSSARFVFPKLKLEQLIREPGGVTVAEALTQANANLETIKPQCREELVALLDQAEAAYEAGGGAVLTDLYGIAVRGIGAGAVCGAPDVDGALSSLCDLIDHLQAAEAMDRDALGVHVRSWRLLMDPHLPRPGAAAILDGLRKVSARFAAST